MAELHRLVVPVDLTEDEQMMWALQGRARRLERAHIPSPIVRCASRESQGQWASQCAARGAETLSAGGAGRRNGRARIRDAAEAGRSTS